MRIYTDDIRALAAVFKANQEVGTAFDFPFSVQHMSDGSIIIPDDKAAGHDLSSFRQQRKGDIAELEARVAALEGR